MQSFNGLKLQDFLHELFEKIFYQIRKINVAKVTT